MRRTTTRWLALAVVTAAALTGCSDDDNGSGGGSDEPAVIEITFEDGEVSPNGDRVEVDAGRPIDLEVTADEPGEIHIHSDPEQQFEYVEGENKFEIQFDRPGIVVVESHDLDKVIVQLEVK